MGNLLSGHIIKIEELKSYKEYDRAIAWAGRWKQIHDEMILE
jgi:hypothetical protein